MSGVLSAVPTRPDTTVTADQSDRVAELEALVATLTQRVAELGATKTGEAKR